MTLQDMLTMGGAAFQEYEGMSQAYDDPFSMAKFFLLQSMDKFARHADAFWYAWQEPAVNGQAGYCAPGLYKLRSINYFTEQGNWYPLNPKDTGFMDGRGGGYGYGPNWRNADPVYEPRRVIIDGMNSVKLYPAPIVDTIASPLVQPLVEFEGYAIPSKCFKSDGTTPLFAAPADECPLNAICHPGIVYDALLMRAIQYPSKENMARVPLLQAQVQESLGDLCGFANVFTPPYRFDQRYRWFGS